MPIKPAQARESHIYWIILALCVTIWIGRVLLLWWNQPAVVEYANLKYLQLLRTSVSSRSISQVEQLENVLKERLENSELNQSEYRMFAMVVAAAQSGDWKKADALALRYEKGQLHRKRRPLAQSPESPTE